MSVHASVQMYYGEVLQSSADLKTDACCTSEEMPMYIKTALSDIHEEVLARYYGCGLVVPELLEGLHVLDLGSGAGRDCYLLSRLVGEQGRVVGVDMTAEQLEVARRHVDFHRERFSYGISNVEFLEGHIEQLDQLPLQAGSFDLVVSNCVLNLAEDKSAVLRQVFDLLKPGGEMYFSDVYSDRRIPQHLVSDPVLYGECLSGALYWNDFQNMAKHAGFSDPRLVTDRPLSIDNEEVRAKIGNTRFYSATYRLVKLEGLEPACEDYGQAVVYRGTIPHHPDAFVLDKHHEIETGRVFPVCGNTMRMLSETRFAPHFEFIGEGTTHFGLFEGCGSAIPFDRDTVPGNADNSESEGCC